MNRALGHLCAHRLNWTRRTSWGWWDDWDDTVLQTQDSKFDPWRSEDEHATSRSRRLPTILTRSHMIWYGMIPYDILRYDTISYVLIRYDTLWYDKKQYDVICFEFWSKILKKYFLLNKYPAFTPSVSIYY